MKSWTTCDGNGNLDREASLPRRELLTVGALGLLWWAGARPSLAQAAFQVKQEHDRVLVVIFLRGGCDGLNVIAPYGEDAYYKSRPSIALAKPGAGGGSLVDLDGFFGLHPAMASLDGLYKEGQMAAVQAVGSGDRTLSHFEAMSTMERGLATETDSGGGGWLGRHLVSTPGKSSPLRAVALSSVMPDSLGGALGALAIESLSDYRLKADDASLLSSLTALYKTGDDPMAQAGRDTLAVLNSLKKLNPAGYVPERGAAYPETGLGKGLKETAFLIKNDLGLEVACLDMGLWDTHVTQGGSTGWHATLLKELADSVSAFMTDLGKERDRVTLVIQTEFGRRVDENSGLGTDHGRASMMLLAGGGVKGGKVYGRWPTLAKDKQDDGNLAVTTDYRDVLAEVLDKRLATASLDKVFPGHRVRPLGIVS